MILRLLRYGLAIYFLNVAAAKLLGAAVWVTTFPANAAWSGGVLATLIGFLAATRLHFARART